MASGQALQTAKYIRLISLWEPLHGSHPDLVEDTGERIPVEIMLTDETAIELNDRHARTILFLPVLPRIDIQDLKLSPASHERQHFLDEFFTPMAAGTAIDLNIRHYVQTPLARGF